MRKMFITCLAVAVCSGALATTTTVDDLNNVAPVDVTVEAVTEVSREMSTADLKDSGNWFTGVGEFFISTGAVFLEEYRARLAEYEAAQVEQDALLIDEAALETALVEEQATITPMAATEDTEVPVIEVTDDEFLSLSPEK